MAVWQRTFDDDCVLARGQRGAAFEEHTEPFDQVGGPIREVEQGPFLDPAVDPIALAQQNGGRGVAVGNGLDIHDYLYHA